MTSNLAVLAYVADVESRSVATLVATALADRAIVARRIARAGGKRRRELRVGYDLLGLRFVDALAIKARSDAFGARVVKAYRERALARFERSVREDARVANQS